MIPLAAVVTVLVSVLLAVTGAAGGAPDAPSGERWRARKPQGKPIIYRLNGPGWRPWRWIVEWPDDHRETGLAGTWLGAWWAARKAAQ